VLRAACARYTASMTLMFEPETSYGAGFYPAGIALADVNGDGHLDVISADFQGGVDVLLGTGTGTLEPATVYNAGQNPVAVAVAGVNGDGRPDILAADELGNMVSVLLGLPNGRFAPAVSYAAGSYPYSVATADFNGDGQTDLVVANSGGGIDVLLGNATGSLLRHGQPLYPDNRLDLLQPPGRGVLATRVAGPACARAAHYSG
jgi:hypothetical protein